MLRNVNGSIWADALGGIIADPPSSIINSLRSQDCLISVWESAPDSDAADLVVAGLVSEFRRPIKQELTLVFLSIDDLQRAEITLRHSPRDFPALPAIGDLHHDVEASTDDEIRALAMTIMSRRCYRKYPLASVIKVLKRFKHLLVLENCGPAAQELLESEETHSSI